MARPLVDRLSATDPEPYDLHEPVELLAWALQGPEPVAVALAHAMDLVHRDVEELAGLT